MDVESSSKPAEPAGLVELKALVAQAQAGDASVLPRIQQILDEHPEVWRHCGDVSGLAENAWLAALSAGNPLVVESRKRTLAEMRADLLGEEPTRLVRMLVDHIIVCWLEVQYVETMSADTSHRGLNQKAEGLKWLESSQKRYFSAIQTLMGVRAMVPAGMTVVAAPKLHEPPEQMQA